MRSLRNSELQQNVKDYQCSRSVDARRSVGLSRKPVDSSFENEKPWKTKLYTSVHQGTNNFQLKQSKVNWMAVRAIYVDTGPI